MTPEMRLLRALDELRDAMGAVLAGRHEPDAPPALLTIAKAAHAIGISRSTATRWADDGRLQTIGPRNARRVPRAEVTRFAAGTKAVARPSPTEAVAFAQSDQALGARQQPA